MLLLDTHVLVWISLAPDRLSKKAIRAINNARNHAGGVLVADITLFEVASLIARKSLELQVSLDSFLEEVESRFVILPITRHIVSLAVQLPPTYPKDPMDRIIGATALVEGVPLVTADEAIQKAKTVETIW